MRNRDKTLLSSWVGLKQRSAHSVTPETLVGISLYQKLWNDKKSIVNWNVACRAIIVRGKGHKLGWIRFKIARLLQRKELRNNIQRTTCTFIQPPVRDSVDCWISRKYKAMWQILSGLVVVVASALIPPQKLGHIISVSHLTKINNLEYKVYWCATVCIIKAIYKTLPFQIPYVKITVSMGIANSLKSHHYQQTTLAQPRRSRIAWHNHSQIELPQEYNVKTYRWRQCK